MSWNGEDLFKAVLLGSGGSSGGGASGGGSAAVSPKEVNFYDYDGTCVHAYTVAEAQALSELPAGPEHPGLVFQGWNWSLEGVKGLTRAMNIGAMYTTDDGTTRLYITLQEGRTSPMLGVGVNGTVTVDWGDGTEPDVLTGTSTSTTKWTPNHAYAAPGDYVIRLTVDGEMAFTGSVTTDLHTSLLRHSNSVDKMNGVYQNALRKVEIGNGVARIESSAFDNCCSLESVTIPDSVIRIGGYAFRKCYSLASAIIPDSVILMSDNAFNACYSLKVVNIPDGVTEISDYAFNNCCSLESVTIPDSVTRIGICVFYNCYALTSVTIPDGVASIGQQTFYNSYSLASVTLPEGVTSIGSQTFNGCRALASVTIPGGVTSIGGNAFNSCYGMSYYDFTACTDVPALSNTTAFKDIPADCEIRVPAAHYDEWIAATNWTTYASQIVAY